MRTDIKCKCGSTRIEIVELWKDHAIYWDQEDGKIDRNEGILEPGNPFKVSARCRDCQKMWTVRGATQIDDLNKDPQ